MGAFTVVSSKNLAVLPGCKIRLITATGPASYDANGSVINLSTSGVLAAEGFTSVTGAVCVGFGAHGSGALETSFVPAASDAAATCTVKVYTGTSDPPAEASGDLSSHTFRFVVFGF